MSQPRDIADAPGILPGEGPDTIAAELAERLERLGLDIAVYHPERDGDTVVAQVTWADMGRILVAVAFGYTLALHQSGRIEIATVTNCGRIRLYTLATGGPDEPIVIDL